MFLLTNSRCKFCLSMGRIVAATVVDHIVPHKGDLLLFWDSSNWQALCAPCHSSIKQREEIRGYSSAIGVDGWPLDERHQANKKITYPGGG